MRYLISKVPAGVRRLARLPWTRARHLRDVNDEMDFHLEMRVTEFRATGMSEAEARDEALRRFGDRDAFRVYAVRVGVLRAGLSRLMEWFADWIQDARFTGRQLRKAPGFAIVAVLTLALGSGANTAIFSVVHHLLLDPLPYPDGNRIVSLWQTAGNGDMRFAPSATVMRAWQMRSRTLESFAAATVRTVRLSPELGDTLVAADMTPGFLDFLRTPPALGRSFTADEAQSAQPNVVMIGHGLWQARYGGRADVVGQVIRVDDRPRTIIGVTGPSVSIPMSQARTPALWLPVSLDSVRGHREFARLRPGVTTPVASAELGAIASDINRGGPEVKTVPRAMRAQDFLDVRESRTIQVLFAAVAALLLVACANVANLLLARAWVRRREFAIRAALGAGRGRVARQVLTESMSLSVIGGALGLLVAYASLRVIIALRPPELANLAGVQLEPAVLLWGLSVSIATGLLFGCAPAILSGGRQVGNAIRTESRNSAGSGAGRRMRSVLVITELALSLVLLVGAGLLIRSFVALKGMDTGFDEHGLISIAAIERGQPTPERTDVVRDALLQRVRALPGVAEAAIGNLPGQGWLIAVADVERDGTTEPAGIHEYTMNFVSPTYFQVAGIPILAGRTLDASSAGAGEVVVNQAFARHLWPDGKAVGSRLRSSANGAWSTVIGVAKDVRLPGRTGDGDRLQMYGPPIARVPSTTLLMRTTGATAAVIPAVRRAIGDADPARLVGSATTGETYLDYALAPARFVMALLVAFAIVAFVLSAVGLYGVIAYTVSQRTREIGVRVALGAQPAAVAKLVLTQGLRMAAGGVALGLVGAAAASRLLASMLYGVTPADPLTYAAIALLLGGIAVAACYVPARRALRIDPVDALRTD